MTNFSPDRSKLLV